MSCTFRFKFTKWGLEPNTNTTTGYSVHDLRSAQIACYIFWCIRKKTAHNRLAIVAAGSKARPMSSPASFGLAATQGSAEVAILGDKATQSTPAYRPHLPTRLAGPPRRPPHHPFFPLLLPSFLPTFLPSSLPPSPPPSLTSRPSSLASSVASSLASSLPPPPSSPPPSPPLPPDARVTHARTGSSASARA